MSFAEIERFNVETRQNAEQRETVVRLGGSLERVVSLANERGYAFTLEDVKDFVSKKAAAKLSETSLADIAAAGASAGGHKATVTTKSGKAGSVSLVLATTATTALDYAIVATTVAVA